MNAGDMRWTRRMLLYTCEHCDRERNVDPFHHAEFLVKNHVTAPCREPRIAELDATHA